MHYRIQLNSPAPVPSRDQCQHLPLQTSATPPKSHREQQHQSSRRSIRHQDVSTQIIYIVVIQAFSLAFLEPIVLFLNIYSALVYGLLYVWFESFVRVFDFIYHFSLAHEGLSFLGVLVGGIIVVPLYLPHYRIEVEPLVSSGQALNPESLSRLLV